MGTTEMRIGTVVRVATAKRSDAVEYTKIEADTWRITRNRRETSNDRQVQWWLDYRPERTTVDDSGAGPVVEAVAL